MGTLATENPRGQVTLGRTPMGLRTLFSGQPILPPLGNHEAED